MKLINLHCKVVKANKDKTNIRLKIVQKAQ